jgi:hypothetical protein
MTPSDLSEIEARLKVLESTPWRRVAGNRVHGTDYHVCTCGGDLRDNEMRFSHDSWKNNAAFIAHAPTDIAALLDEVKRLRKITGETG